MWCSSSGNPWSRGLPGEVVQITCECLRGIVGETAYALCHSGQGTIPLGSTTATTTVEVRKCHSKKGLSWGTAANQSLGGRLLQGGCHSVWGNIWRRASPYPSGFLLSPPDLPLTSVFYTA